MASSDNGTNEKPIDFEDGELDPDLEDRLYAEIYHSNETFVPDYESSITNDNATVNLLQNAETTPSSKKSFVSNSLTDGFSAPLNTENQLPTDNFVEDSTPGNHIDDRQNLDIGPLYYPKSNWAFGVVSESTIDCEAIERPPVGTGSGGRKQRQLAQKGLWLTPENTEQGSTIAQRIVTQIYKESPAVVSRADYPTCVDRSPGRKQQQIAQETLWLSPENTERDRTIVQPIVTPIHKKTPAVDGRVDYPTCVDISAGRKQRQPAQKPLRLSSENTEQGCTIVQPIVTPSHKETPVVNGSANYPTCVDGFSVNQENDLTHNDSCTQSRGKTRKAKQKQKKNVSKRACGKKTLHPYNTADPPGVMIETDKYEVVSKKKKMKKKKKSAAPMVISSDSDDSIVEVPVPPKPPPLVIQLPDSEDECNPSGKNGSKKTKKLPVKKSNRSVSQHDLRTDSSTLDASLESPVAESNVSKTYEVSDEAARSVGDVADVSVEPACPDRETLILNCTEIQRGASSLDEIRQMRETVRSINAHSDDSMTESEATNWVNIAAGQSGATRNQDTCFVDVSYNTADITAGQVEATRDREVCSVDLSNETVNIELWNQTGQKNSASAGIPMENPCTLGERSTVDRTVANKEKTSSVSTINKEKTSSVSTTNKEKILSVSTTSKEKTSSVSTINKEKTLSVLTINKEKTSSVSTINKEKTSSVSTTNKEKTSSVSTINKEKASGVSTTNKEKTSSVSTINKEKTSSVSTINKEKTLSVLTTNKEKTSSVSTTNKEVAGIRKRQNGAASRPFTDFDVPAIPPKRSKRLKDKAMSDYFFKPMSNELQAFYNNPWGGQNMNVVDIQSKMPANPRCWAILDADLQGPTSRRRRTCQRCNTDSHIGRRCPEKAKEVCCYMCGAKGHTESRCPHTMCLTCGRKYGTYRPTCDYCCKLNCNICNGSGHSNDNCPDLWRRYHNTTTETMPVVPGDPMNIMKAPQYLWCCNCGRRGHDVTTCQQLRWSQHFPTPMSVSSYTEGPFYESSNREQTQYQSSNHEQMQYRSSNSEQMQYDSSNHQQMQYESSNREQMQCGSSNHDQMQYESSSHYQMQYESSSHEQMQYESSSHDQMQYELANREPMQYDSSNRRQMPYESSGGEQMQYALPNEGFVHGVPHDERIGYPNPNADSVYVPQHQERIQDTTPSNDIEILEVYDGPEAPITAPTSSEPSSNVIFQSGDTFLQFLQSVWITRRLDKMKNIHLDGLLNGRLKPTFLLTWNKSFQFTLRITREPNNIVRMTIEANTSMLLDSLEKVMIQWLRRPDDEKQHLEYDIFPYDNIDAMIGNIKPKTLLLRTVLEPAILWKKIVACEESLKHIRAKHSRCLNQRRAQKRYEKNVNGIIFNTMKRRSQLVTSLYVGNANRSWVAGGAVLVRLFKNIAYRLVSKKNITEQHYLDLIYLNNELFTFHTSEALSKALDKAVLKSQRSGSVTAPIAKKPSVETSAGKLPEFSTEPIAKKPSVDTSAGKLPESTEPIASKPSVDISAGKLPESMEPIAKKPSVDSSAEKLPESSTEPMANVDVCEKKKSTANLPKQPMINNNSLAADCSPLTPHREQQIIVVDDTDSHTDVQNPKIFGATDAVKKISSQTNDEAGVDNHTLRNPLFRQAAVKGPDSQNAVQRPPSFQRKVIKSGGPKKVGNTKGLLRLLTKRNRKRYKMLAKQVIKVANLTKVPHLQEMAKALKLKSGNGSITTYDVDRLQAAIGPKLSQITQNSPSRRSGESVKNNDNTYEQFLKSL